MSKRYLIQSRKLVEVCTDPQRRCYNGVYFSSEMQWTEWADLYHLPTLEDAEESVDSWRKLNPKTHEYRHVDTEA